MGLGGKVHDGVDLLVFQDVDYKICGLDFTLDELEIRGVLD